MRNDQIRKMRQEGYTLQYIADQYNITRERVRQILAKFYHEDQHPHGFIGPKEAAGKLGITENQLLHIARKLGVSPCMANKGGNWDEGTIKLIDIYVKTKPRCRICGSPVPKGRSTLCSDECYRESRKYKNRSAEAKQHQNKATRKWRTEHPGRRGKIQQQAQLKYNRKVVAGHKYIITYDCQIPKGKVVFNAGPRQDNKIPVNWQGETYLVPCTYLKLLPFGRRLARLKG